MTLQARTHKQFWVKQICSVRASRSNSARACQGEQQKKRPTPHFPPLSFRRLDSLPSGSQWQKWPMLHELTVHLAWPDCLSVCVFACLSFFAAWAFLLLFPLSAQYDCERTTLLLKKMLYLWGNGCAIPSSGGRRLYKRVAQQFTHNHHILRIHYHYILLRDEKS